MGNKSRVSRRKFIQSAPLAVAATLIPRRLLARYASVAGQSGDARASGSSPLEQFDYSDVVLTSEIHEQQLEQTHAVLMGLNEDSLMKPFREMSGQPAPGEDLGGWYPYVADFQWGKDNSLGFAPTCTFGQWVSALARYYAIRKDAATREKVLRLNRLYAKTITDDYYDKNRFPTYCYDKIVCGLIDSHRYVGDPDAFSILDQTTKTAFPHFPGHAVAHGLDWRHKGDVWAQDESYTISENLFLAYQLGAGEKYRELGRQYLFDEYYDPLSQGQNALAGRHAYSHVNSLSSAMQAYLTLGSEKHLQAAKNGFDMLVKQSFATGGWGPDETLRASDSPDVYASLNKTHASFETPCGSYAHFKLTRYLLRVTREARYGDSMERVMYNTVLGAKPLMPDGRTFYYSDYNFNGHKFYRPDQHWACCSGTLPQVTADYRINAYFRDSEGVWVNLYIPSTLRWQQDGADIAITQEGSYPFESTMQFRVNASRPKDFALKFRIPAWTTGATISVNGKVAAIETVPESFVSIRREWKSDDRIEVDLPMRLRIEAIDPEHPQTVALMYGPLVLFGITDVVPSLTRADLLNAQRVDQQSWQVRTAANTFTFLPFIKIEDQQYSTYLNVT
jgi:uncharacterized protein